MLTKNQEERIIKFFNHDLKQLLCCKPLRGIEGDKYNTRGKFFAWGFEFDHDKNDRDVIISITIEHSNCFCTYRRHHQMRSKF